MSDATRPPGEDLVRAAEHGDQLAFAALAQRLGTLEQAQEIVRRNAFVRMAERAVARPRLPLAELRAPVAADKNTDPVLFGHFAVFDTPTEIDSMFEGHFIERIAPGAFKKTFRELSPRVLFQHGKDPYLGDKVLGTPDPLREDEIGAPYNVPLFRGLPELLLDGIRAGEYGASFRFRVLREQWDENPDPSDDNPDGLPERMLKEVQVPEFGPVTFPAYASATAGLRSATGDGADDDEVTVAPSKADAAGEEHLGDDTRRRSEPGTSSTERRETEPTPTWPRVSQEEWTELWIPEI